MKTAQFNNIARLAIATALLVGTAGVVTAGETSTSKVEVAKVIDLHAPNNATQTVTIWKPRTASRSTNEIVTARNFTAKTIDLHAPNNAIQTVTIWKTGTEPSFAVTR